MKVFRVETCNLTSAIQYIVILYRYTLMHGNRKNYKKDTLEQIMENFQHVTKL